MRGPSHWTRRSHRWLVRKAVVLEHQVGRLRAEGGGVVWADPVEAPRANMTGIRTRQGRSVDERVTALARVLDELAVARPPERDRFVIARRMAEILGRPVNPNGLYRAPYDTMWRDVAPDAVFGDHPADRAWGAGALARLTVPALVHRIGRMTAEREALREARRDVLIRESMEQGWEPLPDRLPVRAVTVATARFAETEAALARVATPVGGPAAHAPVAGMANVSRPARTTRRATAPRAATNVAPAAKA